MRAYGRLSDSLSSSKSNAYPAKITRKPQRGVNCGLDAGLADLLRSCAASLGFQQYGQRAQFQKYHPRRMVVFPGNRDAIDHLPSWRLQNSPAALSSSFLQNLSRRLVAT